jgi:serine phosphatase RsbU (regulator of sigma subunit)
MALVTLKSLLARKKETSKVLSHLLDIVDATITVEDTEGKILLGAADANQGTGESIQVNGDTLGYVKGGPFAVPVAELLGHLVSKESEKKTLGREVLHLYREINLIYNFSEKLATALEPSAVAKIAVEEASQMIRATAGAVMLLDEQKEALESIANVGQQLSYLHRTKLEEGIVGTVAASGNAEIVNDVWADSRHESSNNGTRSLLCAPLKVKEEVIGVIVLGSEMEVSYTAADLKLLNTLAVQTASAIESALLHEKAIEDAKERERQKTQMALLEAENHRKSEELEEARRLQLSMLPKDIPQLPTIEIAVHMETATEVGGDYYDFHVSEDGTLTTVIGDATGHGLKAGMMVTTAKSLFSTLAKNPDIPSTFNEMNHSIKSMKLPLLAMCMAMIKIQHGAMRISSAGIPPALVYRNATGAVEEISLSGTPLGAMRRFPYRENSIPLSEGDTILLMSDGFPELMNDRDEMLDYQRAQAAFKENANQPPQMIIDALVKTSKDWANGRPYEDDVTFVVLKVKEVIG